MDKGIKAGEWETRKFVRGVKERAELKQRLVMESKGHYTGKDQCADGCPKANNSSPPPPLPSSPLRGCSLHRGVMLRTQSAQREWTSDTRAANPEAGQKPLIWPG